MITDDMREALALAARAVREGKLKEREEEPEEEPASFDWDEYWRRLDRRLLRAYRLAGTAYAVAKRTGVPYSTVHRRLTRQGIVLTSVTRQSRPYKEADMILAWERFGQVAPTARAVGGCYETVRKHLIRLGLHEEKLR